jgi:hypothetical protein
MRFARRCKNIENRVFTDERVTIRLFEQANKQATQQADQAMRGGVRSTSFKPGVSGNAGGRPKKPQTIEAKRIIADVKALARECAPEAIETLKAIMLDAKSPAAVRVSAAQVLLDRGHGRPAQAIDVSGEVAFDFSRLSNDELDEYERLLMIVALPGPGNLYAENDDARPVGGAGGSQSVGRGDP